MHSTPLVTKHIQQLTTTSCLKKCIVVLLNRDLGFPILFNTLSINCLQPTSDMEENFGGCDQI